MTYTRGFQILGWWWGFGMAVAEDCPKYEIFLVVVVVYIVYVVVVVVVVVVVYIFGLLKKKSKNIT